jgi:outer membrane protein OmpA-like peptidoglycan-associated protein
MPDKRATLQVAPSARPDAPAADPADLAELRELILGAERRRLEELERRLDTDTLTRESLAELLPEAIVLRARRDRQLARALAPTVENAIGESVRRNPRPIATAIFPVLGPAIRKAIAEALAGLVSSINHTVEHSLSPRGLRWRLEAWRTGVPYGQIVLRHALIYRVEQVFLIHRETGLLLAHAVAPDLAASDADLISGMLTAIRDFVADSFSSEREAGGLRRFSVGELTVMVEQGPQALIAAVVRGEAPDSLLVELQETLETIHLQFAGALEGFDGETAPFESARPLLEECLSTVMATDRQQGERRRVVWVPWLLVALVLALLLGGLAVRSRLRWNGAVARLRSEPGIMLTEAERDGRQWRFAGLRDPLARDPAVLLAAQGVDMKQVDQRWEPYLSLDPAFVLARARRNLAPPAGVKLALQGDTLRATGSAPLEWVGSVGRVAPVPGVTSFDLSGVTPELPAELSRLKGEIESEQMLFEVGSSAIDATALDGVTRVAERFGRLEAGADRVGARATLELVGRTDPTGSDAANQALSRDRAEAVFSALAARGVPRSQTRVSALGTTRPLERDDPEERARINRSVSFAVSVAPK